MKTISSLVLLLVFAIPANGQRNLALYHDHSRYLDTTATVRRFKHEEVMKAVDGLKPGFRITGLGRSVEGRAIRMVSYGQGPVNVLMWSQMHGDETTATRAILDVFRFLKAKDSYDDLRELLRTRITWHFIPMLNPDGAARFTRRNQQGIDINRDAIRLQTPEGRILKRVRDSLRADWGFNLHDQNRGTSVNGKPASISLLAPPFDVGRSINESRGDAMQLTKFMFDQATGFLPGQIGIYPDEFEPRAFGDNLQKWGTRTVLIESGGFQNDFEKCELRRINFVLLITAVEAIANGAFEKVPVNTYNDIPHNSDRRLFELILRNLSYEGIVRDVAWDRREIDSEDFRRYAPRGLVADLGDLSTFAAYVEFDAVGYSVTAGKSYDPVLSSYAEFEKLPLDKLMREGYTDFVVKGPFDRFGKAVKVNIAESPVKSADKLTLGSNPSLLLWKNGVLEYLVINGVLHSAK
jgi:hypothetical protein